MNRKANALSYLNLYTFFVLIVGLSIYFQNDDLGTAPLAEKFEKINREPAMQGDSILSSIVNFVDATYNGAISGISIIFDIFTFRLTQLPGILGICLDMLIGILSWLILINILRGLG